VNISPDTDSVFKVLDTTSKYHIHCFVCCYEHTKKCSHTVCRYVYDLALSEAMCGSCIYNYICSVLPAFFMLFSLLILSNWHLGWLTYLILVFVFWKIIPDYPILFGNWSD
jgi:hypothetical protein